MVLESREGKQCGLKWRCIDVLSAGGKLWRHTLTCYAMDSIVVGILCVHIYIYIERERVWAFCYHSDGYIYIYDFYGTSIDSIYIYIYIYVYICIYIYGFTHIVLQVYH